MPKPLRIVAQDALALVPEDRRRLVVLLIESMELAELRDTHRPRGTSSRDPEWPEGSPAEAVAAAVVDADLASGKHPVPASIFARRPEPVGRAGVPTDAASPEIDIPWTQEVERGWFTLAPPDGSNESEPSSPLREPILTPEPPSPSGDDSSNPSKNDPGLGRWLLNPLRPR